MVSRRRGETRADPRHRRPLQGHQRTHPLRARRQPADRADAWRAQRLRGLRLHLRHRPGRRRGQGADGMGHRRPHRMGHVVVRPAPLHEIRGGAGLRRRQGPGSLRPRIRDPLPAPRLAGGPQPQAVADPRPYRGPRRAVQRLQWLGARHLVRAGGRRHFRASDTDLRPFRPVGKADSRGMPRRARRRRHSGPARLLALRRRRAERPSVAVVAYHGRRAEARQDRTRILRRQRRTHRDRNVDHVGEGRLLSPDHRSGCRTA